MFYKLLLYAWLPPALYTLCSGEPCDDKPHHPHFTDEARQSCSDRGSAGIRAQICLPRARELSLASRVRLQMLPEVSANPPFSPWEGVRQRTGCPGVSANRCGVSPPHPLILLPVNQSRGSSP